MTATVLHGDCIEVLAGMEPESIDAVVTDPPYHLGPQRTQEIGWPSWNGQTKEARTAAKAGFMGKTWDGGDIAFRPETWAAALQVMKPGAYMVCFASTRGYHRMVCAIEDAGFIIHPMIGWLFGTGFPKAHRVEAEGWEGWRYGLQSLKPALEPICLAQKPMRERTGTAQVLATGTGAINVDGCRVATDESTRRRNAAEMGYHGGNLAASYETGSDAGRWPANLAHDGSDEVLEAFAAFGEKTSSMRGPNCGKAGGNKTGNGIYSDLPQKGYAAGTTYGDTGTAARFFYSSKASRADRAGSKHPTVKPVALMRWLCRMVTPPGGTVLDPFAGSGTTGEAALLEGFRPVLIEREAEYHADILARLARHVSTAPLLAEAA